MSVIVRSMVYLPRYDGEKFLVVSSAASAQDGRCISQHSAWALDSREAALKCCELARLATDCATTGDLIVSGVHCSDCPTPARQHEGWCLSRGNPDPAAAMP
jgi:hypothetical protein